MHKTVLKHLIAVVIFLSAALLLLSATDNEEGKRTHLPFEKVIINGTYSYSESEPGWELTTDTILDDERSDVYISGNFTKSIPLNRLVMLRVDNIKVEIHLNGTLFYSYGEFSGHRFYNKADGNVWTFFISPGITPDDKIEIHLQNPYGPQGVRQLTEFVRTMYTGYDIELFQSVLALNAPRLFSATLVFCSGLVLLFACVVLLFTKVPNNERFFYFSGFTMASGVWFFIRFDIMSFFVPLPLFNNLLDSISLLFIALFFLAYLLSFINGKSRAVLLVTEYLYIAFCLVYFIAILFGRYDPYSNQFVRVILMAFLSVLSVSCVLYESIWGKDANARDILFSVMILGLGCVADVVNYYVLHTNITLVFNICFFVFISIEYVKMVRFFIVASRKAETAAHLETKMLQNNIAIMLSQIQPHFLYNALTSIHSLCHNDPAKAEKAVADFTEFLRGNMDSLSSTKPIPFEQELAHLEHYLAIEKMRFDEKLNIVFDIEATDFLVPPLTLQPLVENAVRHGIMKRAHGGTVRVVTREFEMDYVIIVTDDGTGFDPQMPPTNERPHYGIENVRHRIEAMCGGILTIDSSPDIGTIATISLPK